MEYTNRSWMAIHLGVRESSRASARELEITSEQWRAGFRPYVLEMPARRACPIGKWDIPERPFPANERQANLGNSPNNLGPLDRKTRHISAARQSFRYVHPPPYGAPSDEQAPLPPSPGQGIPRMHVEQPPAAPSR